MSAPVGRPASLSLPARITGVLTSPRRTFSAIVDAPRWADVLLLTTVLIAGAAAAFMSTDVGPQALLDQYIATLENFGRTVDDAQYVRMQEQLGVTRQVYVGTLFVGVPAGAFALAAVLFGVFTGALRGHASYQQVLAVVAHSGVVLLLRSLCALPLNYLRESLSHPANLGAFIPVLSEGTFIANFLGTIDLFLVWWIVVLAVGLGVLYGRNPRRLAAAIGGIYAAAALILAGLATVLGTT
jgi:hypothetical protein